MLTYEQMLFRRQYLITNQSVDIFPHWKVIKSEQKINFYLHPDLEFAHAKEGEVEVILLGFILSYQNPQKTNNQIVEDLARNRTLKGFIESCNHLGGRYVLFYANAEGHYLLTDPISTRKAFYYFDTKSDAFWIAAQVKLMSQFVELEKQDDPTFVDFVEGEPFHTMKNFMVGDATLYKEVKQLLPNHYLDIKSKTKSRFFPTASLPTIPVDQLDETAVYLNSILRGFLEALTLRYKINMPFTAGADSRALISVSKNFKDKIHYYINQYPYMSDTYADIWVPKKLSQHLGIPFTINPVPSDALVSEDFKKAYQNSYDTPIDQYMASHYIQAQLFDNVVVMHTVGSETAKRKSTLGIEDRKVTPLGLNILTYYDPFEPYPLQEAHKWFEEIQPFAHFDNINLCELYAWENTKANFVGSAMVQGDLYCETCSIFNCREFISKMWAVPFSHRQPIHKFSLAMMKQAWAEVLVLPINPPSSFKGYIKDLLIRWGVYGYAKARKYVAAEKEMVRRTKGSKT